MMTAAYCWKFGPVRGDESALFAGDLFRMYSRYAERQRWQVEVMSASESELGGTARSSVELAAAGPIPG